MAVVIISGGSSGIGKACVQKFLENTYFVYNLDITNNASDFINYNNYEWIATDVTNPEIIKNVISQITQQHKKIDALIVSAGKHISANIENSSEQELNDLLNLNVKGAFWLIKEIIPHMKATFGGSIITIGSDQSTIAKTNSTIYGMTKAALLSLTKSIALDYAKYNIRANCVGAGTIDTPLYRNAIVNYATKSGVSLAQIEKDEASTQPIGRIGTTKEVAELVYFLAQDISSFITGAIVPIDGGYTAR